MSRSLNSSPAKESYVFNWRTIYNHLSSTLDETSQLCYASCNILQYFQLPKLKMIFEKKRGLNNMKTFCFVLLTAALLLLGGVGCGQTLVRPTWELGQSSPTNVVPALGYHQFITSHPINDSYHGRFIFGVVKDKYSLQPTLRFSADGYRFDLIPIQAGAFYWTHGQIDGLDSPTDGYGISGHFVAPDRAEGTIKLAITGTIVAEATFITNLDYIP